MVKARCPVCKTYIDLGEEPLKGETINCPQCHSILEIQKRGRRFYLEIIEKEEIEEE